MAEPARALQTLPFVTLDVGFQEGKLWKPRYPSLIRDDLVPEIQFEPAFQVCSKDLWQVEFRFQIVGNDAVFAVDDRGVRWQSLVPDNSTPNVVVELVQGDPRTCRVLWTRSGARLTALRIACEPVIPPPDDEAAALTQVEGGVYLAITDPGEVHHFLGRPHPSPPTVSGRVQVVGIDAKSRPVYDLFDVTGNRAAIPAGLTPEVAFRVRHGELAELPLALALPPGPFADTTFETDEDGEVVMTYVVPSERPEELLDAAADEGGHLCKLTWRVPSRNASKNGLLCTTGRASTFFAQLNPGSSLRDPYLRAALAWVSVDPTVIEPPPCDASGVCTKPRDQGS